MDHLSNLDIYKSIAPDKMDPRVPRELADITATLSSLKSHGNGEGP